MVMNTKKDVLILCKYFYPEYITSGRLPYETALALVDEGVTVGVICGYPKEYNTNGKVPRQEVHQDIHIKRLKYLQMQRTSFFGRIVNYFSYTLSVLFQLLSFHKYEVIMVYSTPPVLPIVAAWASKIFRKKLIFVSYDVYPEIALKTNSIRKNGSVHKVMNYINKTLFKEVNKVVAISKDMKEMLLKNRTSLQEKQVEVIPNWYEDRKSSEKDSAFSNRLFKEMEPKENLVISYLGNMGTAQELETLLEAMKQLKNRSGIKFLFAGHGNQMERLKKFKTEEQISNLIIFEYLHGDDYKAALTISDALIVTLKKELTGLAVPSRTYSFMMAQKPIIALMDLKTEMAKELVEHNAGYAIEPGEVNELIEAIDDLKNHKAERKIKGEHARALFEEKYTKEKGTAQYVALIKEVLTEENRQAVLKEAER